MNPILRNILFVAVFSFALSFDCCYFGTAYDTHYQLYPEYEAYSCVPSKYYGARWQILGTALFYLFLGSTVAIFIHLYRDDQTKHFDRLRIHKP